MSVTAINKLLELPSISMALQAAVSAYIGIWESIVGGERISLKYHREYDGIGQCNVSYSPSICE